MTFPDNIESKIGFDKVRALVKAECLSSLGADRVDDMAFSADFESVNILVNQTAEFLTILQGKDDFPT